MRKLMLTLAAAGLAIPATVAIPADQAQARERTYKSRQYTHSRKRCRPSKGTTGLIAGGVGGAVLGNAVGGGLLGTVAGGAAGALGGRAIDRSMTADKRCR